MPTLHRRRWLAAVIFAAAAAPRPATAQIEKALTADAQHFGTFTGTTRINAAGFVAPDIGSMVNNRVVCDDALYCRGAAGVLIVPLDLPNGALLVSAYLYLVDNDCGMSEDVTLALQRYFDDFVTGDNEGFESVASASSSGCTGTQQIAISPNLVIRSVDDVDGNDGVVEAISHVFKIYTPANGTAVRALELNWHATIKPAPQTAHFNDVTALHAAFREIEALYASGATEGCDLNGNYCPDNPVTRAQLAVILSRLLGLYWPN